MVFIKAVLKQILLKLIPIRVKDLVFREICEKETFSSHSKYAQVASMDWSLENLKQIGFSPKNILDIGAFQGEWTKQIKKIWPNSHVLMVEPQESKKGFLEQVVKAYPETVSYVSNLLGPESGEDISFFEMETGSSVFEEQSNVARTIINKTVISLDDLLEGQNFSNVDLLKIDVQGFELEVFKGAASTLKSVEVVLMEVSLIPINKGAPLIEEVTSFMKTHGFVAYDVCTFWRRPQDNALWQVDMIFVEEKSFLLADKVFVLDENK